MSILEKIERNFWVFFLLAILIGLLIPDYVSWLSKYSTFFLMAILLVLFFKIDIAEVASHLKRPFLLSYIVGMNLIIIPLLLYLLFRPLGAEIVAGVLLLAALPTGVSTAALTELTKGKTSMTLAITVLSNILAPFTIAGLFYFILGADIQVPVGKFFVTMAALIFLPLILSQIGKHFLKKKSTLIARNAGAITVILLTIIIAGVIGAGADEVLANLKVVLLYLFFAFVAFFLFLIVSYLMVFWLKKEERWAVATSKVYMNPVMGIVLATTFFSPQVTLFLILAEIPWNTTLGIFNWLRKFLP